MNTENSISNEQQRMFADIWHGAVKDILEVFPDHSILSEAELQRMDKFLFDKDKKAFAAAHILARNMLSEYADVSPEKWQFINGPYGRPEITPGLIHKPLFFNISHKPDAVCCLVSNIAECGVDLEDHHRKVDWPNVGKRVFTSHEQNYCNSNDDNFRNIWCLKESYMKAIGLGFNIDPASFSFTIDNNGISLDNNPCWTFLINNINDKYTIAAAVNFKKNLEIQVKATRPHKTFESKTNC